jgi:antitoxin MazE
MTTRTRIVRIGNSRGIRVPKVLLEEAGLPEEVELRAEPGRLVVSAATRPRTGWASKARAMHQRRHDELLDPGMSTEFDDTDWRW